MERLWRDYGEIEISRKRNIVLVCGAKCKPLHKLIEPIGDDSFWRFGAQIAPFPFRPIP